MILLSPLSLKFEWPVNTFVLFLTDKNIILYDNFSEKAAQEVLLCYSVFKGPKVQGTKNSVSSRLA
jgi:hypothetical protein